MVELAALGTASADMLSVRVCCGLPRQFGSMYPPLSTPGSLAYLWISTADNDYLGPF